MVNQKSLLISILGLVALAGYIFNSIPLDNNPVKQAEQFQYYVFEREIPASVCKQRKCKQDYLLNYDGSSMNMHGLWPSGSSSDVCYHPASCNDLEYNQSLVDSSLVQWMNEQYVGLYSSSTTFRAHEFEKHGTCTLEANQMSTRELENHYFGQIQKLNQKYDLISALNKGGIYASDDKSYTYQEIVAALKNGFEGQSDYDVKIQCLTVDDTIYLGAIDLYIDLDFNLGKDLCAASKSEMVTSFNMCSQSKPIFFPKFDWKQVSE